MARLIDVLEEHLRGLDDSLEKTNRLLDITIELRSFWNRGSIGAGIILFLRGDL